jgi:hypothetical protein
MDNILLLIGVIIIVWMLFNPVNKQEHFTPSEEKIKLIKNILKMFREKKLVVPKIKILNDMKITKDVNINGDVTCNKLLGNDVTVNGALNVNNDIECKYGKNIDSKYLTVSGNNNFDDLQIYGYCKLPNSWVLYANNKGLNVMGIGDDVVNKDTFFNMRNTYANKIIHKKGFTMRTHGYYIRDCAKGDGDKTEDKPNSDWEAPWVTWNKQARTPSRVKIYYY